jgi:hypothetical protein
MRLGPVLATCALVALLAGGCSGGDDEPEPVAAADLPDNLCAAVPDNVVARWGLAEDSHATDAADDRSVAGCIMIGTAAGAPVSLHIIVTSYGGSSADSVRALVTADLAARCDRLEQEAAGRYQERATRCSTEAPGDVTEISRSVPSHGVVSVTMKHDGTMRQLVGAEVVGLSGVLANSEPDDLS